MFNETAFLIVQVPNVLPLLSVPTIVHFAGWTLVAGWTFVSSHSSTQHVMETMDPPKKSTVRSPDCISTTISGWIRQLIQGESDFFPQSNQWIHVDFVCFSLRFNPSIIPIGVREVAKIPIPSIGKENRRTPPESMEARMASQSKWRPFVQISFCPHRSRGFRASFHHSSPKSHGFCLRLCLSLITGRNCTWQKAPTKNKQIHSWTETENSSQETSLQHSGCLFSGHVEEGMAPTRKCLKKKYKKH